MWQICCLAVYRYNWIQDCFETRRQTVSHAQGSSLERVPRVKEIQQEPHPAHYGPSENPVESAKQQFGTWTVLRPPSGPLPGKAVTSPWKPRKMAVRLDHSLNPGTELTYREPPTQFISLELPVLGPRSSHTERHPRQPDSSLGFSRQPLRASVRAPSGVAPGPPPCTSGEAPTTTVLSVLCWAISHQLTGWTWKGPLRVSERGGDIVIPTGHTIPKFLARIWSTVSIFRKHC